MNLALLVVVVVGMTERIKIASSQTCDSDYSCALQTMTSTATCTGYFSCYESDITVSTTISCSGSYACYKAIQLSQTSSTQYNIECFGLRSCAEISKIYVLDGNVQCYGEQSCMNSVITVMEDSIYCYGSQSCLGATIYSRTYNYMYGYQSGKDATFYSRDSSVNYYFYGIDSGNNATIICGNGHTCNIYCNLDAYGCSNQLNLTCIGTCTFSVSSNDLLLTKNSGLSLIDSIPDISNYDNVFSTYDNSFSACYSPITDAYNCDDKNGCKSTTFGSSMSNKAICCTAAYSCYNSMVNSDYVINNGTSLAYNSGMRCDSYQSCYSITASFTNNNENGIYNVYFSGYESGKAADNIGFLSDKKDNILCNGANSCYSAPIQHANNVYCLANAACQYSTISYVSENIYAYGPVNVARYSTMAYILGSIYCLTDNSCRDSTITNVNGNVIGARGSTLQSSTISQVNGSVIGYGGWSLKTSKISNVINVVCYFDASCQAATIRSIRSIVAKGTDALSDSTIVSEVGANSYNTDDNNVLTISIYGNNTSKFKVYCNSTDTCKIDCQSRYACEKLELRCFGTCFVDCDEDTGGDIKCPFFGFYTKYNASNVEPPTTTTTTTDNNNGDTDANYQCDIENDGLILSWDSLFTDSSYSLYDDATISLSQGINDDTGVFEVTVNVMSKYLIGATYEEYSQYYESVTSNGDYLGVTYVLDTNIFDGNDRMLSNGNNCENRKSSSYINKHFLNDYWDYTLYPGNSTELGNDKYLEYPNPNIWDLKIIGDNCDKIRWKNTFSFNDLMTECSDMYGNPSFNLVENENDITVTITFYLAVVSPDPLFLTACDNGATDCGRYISSSLISHPLSMVFNKQQSIVSNEDNIMIGLFTIGVYNTKFIEQGSNSLSDQNYSQFELTLITTVPQAIALDVTTAILLSPTKSYLINSNNNIDFIHGNIEIEENIEEYFDSDCLIMTNNRCFQLFTIIIPISQCPTDSRISFDADYFLSADFICRDLDNNGTSIGEQSECDDYLDMDSIPQSPLSITFDSISVTYEELCDSTLYDIDWTGNILLYNDDIFTQIENEFEGGDTVYAKISMSNDISNYDIFGMFIEQCYVCIGNSLNDGDDSINNSSQSGCLINNNNINNMNESEIYIISQDSLDYKLIDSNYSDTFEQFSFTLPKFASINDNIFYIECIVELVVSSHSNEHQRRMVSNGDGNIIDQIIGIGYITYDDENGGSISNDDDNDNSIVWHMIIGLLSCLLLCCMIAMSIGIWYCKNKNQSKAKEATMDMINNAKPKTSSA